MISKPIMEIFHSYNEVDISAIPCKKVWDEKSRTHTGKVSAISNWSRFCEELPIEEEVDGWQSLNNVYGVAAVTGIASNLCCIDIDTEDEELSARLVTAIPPTPLIVKGNPRRAGKFIYRLHDDDQSYRPPADLKVSIKDPRSINGRKSAVDVFFGNAYICLPPRS